jgi:hypothetical protein
VLWSLDGKKLATSNWDGGVTVWDVAGDGSPEARQRQRESALARAPRWHVDRAEVGLAAGDLDVVAFHLRRLERMRLPGAVRWARGHLYARLCRWDEAAGDLVGRSDLADLGSSSEARDLDESLALRSYSLLCARVRDANRLAHCREFLWRKYGDRGGEIGTPPDLLAVTAIAPLGEYRDRAVKVARRMRKDPRKYSWHLHVCALTFLRAGHLDDAIACAHESIKCEANWALARPANSLLLALAHARRGEAAEAKKLVELGRAWFDEERRKGSGTGAPTSVSWQDWLHLCLLLEEAEKLVRR